MVESIDDTLQTSEEVEKVTTLTSLATIPHITLRDRKAQTQIDRRIHGRHSTHAAVSCPVQSQIVCRRDLSRAAQFPAALLDRQAAAHDGRNQRLSRAKEKPPRPSTCAIAFAQRGERVLLVDADLRRGTLDHIFNLKDRSFGLSTVLTQPEANRDLPARCRNCPMLQCCQPARGLPIPPRCSPPIAWRSSCVSGRRSSTG